MLRQMKTGMMFLSVGYIAVGLLLLCLPQASLRWICYAFGAVILISGAVNLIRYFSAKGKGIRAPFMIVSGVTAMALGVFLLLSPEFVLSILPVVFGLFIVVDGAIRVESSIELAKVHAGKWWVLLLLGLLSICLGLLVILHPFDAVIGVTMLSGILLVVEGALNLVCVMYGSMELHALARLAENAAKSADAISVTADEIPETQHVPAASAPCACEAASSAEAHSSATDAAQETASAIPEVSLPEQSGPELPTGDSDFPANH
jgi:uncharacterized membrane protein HdeD (DUF308 family)